MRRFLIALSIATLGIGASTTPAGATHSWGGYHWARTANPFTLKAGDNVSSKWRPFLLGAAADWSVDTVTNPLNAAQTVTNPLNVDVVTGGTRPRSCRVKTGHIEVCSAAYGYTGWLGIAQIWVGSDLHITKGTAKMNDSYFALDPYTSDIWHASVMCQEIGHTFGLDHQDTSGADFHTCMDYATVPDLDNTQPNYHDYEELATIYGHPDSTTTIAAPAQGAGSSRVVSTTRIDRSTIVRRYADGSLRITYIVWAR